jgi:hypothetical protein
MARESPIPHTLNLTRLLFFPLITYLLSLITLFIACDQPDPNMPQVVDDTLNITELTNAIAAGPGDFDVSGYVKLRGSWESFAGAAGVVAANDDPLGKLYAAIAPLQQQANKTIMLDLSRVSGGNIADTPYVALSGRSYKTAIRAIKLPADMISIGGYSFNGCGNLETITFTANTPPTIPVSALTGVSANLTLEVPPGMESHYAALKTSLEAPGIITVTVIGYTEEDE